MLIANVNSIPKRERRIINSQTLTLWGYNGSLLAVLSLAPFMDLKTDVLSMGQCTQLCKRSIMPLCIQSRYMHRLKDWQLKEDEDEELHLCIGTRFTESQDLFASKILNINISKLLLHPCARGLKAEFQEFSPFVKSAGILS